MSNEWSEVAVPGPVEVGDHKLLPLTYGHVVLMERIDLEEVLNPVDYWAFIGICSRPFKSACRWIGFYLSPVGQWLYRHKPLPKDKAKAYSQAITYMHQSLKTPELMTKDGSGSGGGAKHGAPSLQVMRTVALSKLNYSPDTIMDAPFLQLVWDILAYNEQMGGARIIAGELEHGLEELKRRQEEREHESICKSST